MLKDAKRTYLSLHSASLALGINWFLLHYLLPVIPRARFYIVKLNIIERGFSSFANGDIRKLKFEKEKENWHRWYITREKQHSHWLCKLQSHCMLWKLSIMAFMLNLFSSIMLRWFPWIMKEMATAGAHEWIFIQKHEIFITFILTSSFLQFSSLSITFL